MGVAFLSSRFYYKGIFMVYRFVQDDGIQRGSFSIRSVSFDTQNGLLVTYHDKIQGDFIEIL